MVSPKSVSCTSVQPCFSHCSATLSCTSATSSWSTYTKTPFAPSLAGSHARTEKNKISTYPPLFFWRVRFSSASSLPHSLMGEHWTGSPNKSINQIGSLQTIFGRCSDILSTCVGHFVDIPFFWTVQRFARYNSRSAQFPALGQSLLVRILADKAMVVRSLDLRGPEQYSRSPTLVILLVLPL